MEPNTTRLPDVSSLVLRSPPPSKSTLHLRNQAPSIDSTRQIIGTEEKSMLKGRPRPPPIDTTRQPYLSEETEASNSQTQSHQTDRARRSDQREEDYKMMLQHAISSPSVQIHLPDLQDFEATHGFQEYYHSKPLNLEPRVIRDYFIEFAQDLDRHERKAGIWKVKYKESNLSLKKLLHNFDEKSGQVARESLIGLGFHAVEGVIDVSRYDLNARAERDLGLPEFEDLYYLLACKARALYVDLQTRFASGFITMETLLYDEKPRKGKPVQAPRMPCTVHNFRNMIRALWFRMLHPDIVRVLVTAINKRKYQHLKAHPLVPRMSDDDGSQLDATPIKGMFQQHLVDVSKVPIPELLDQIVRRTRLCQVRSCPTEAPPVKFEERRSKDSAWRDLRTNLKQDKENHIDQEMVRPGSASEDDTLDLTQISTTFVQPPPRTTSLMSAFTLAPKLPPRPTDSAGNPSPAEKTQIWLPHAAVLENTRSQAGRANAPIFTPPVSPVGRVLFSDTSTSSSPVSPMSKTPHSNGSRFGVSSLGSRTSQETHSTASQKAYMNLTPSSKYSQSVPLTSPPTAFKGQTVTDSPSSRRLPFHGNDEYLPPPPFLPPKSPEQIAAAAQAARARELREREMRNENAKLKRENSQLQEALQQIHAHRRIQREQSQLQEALQQFHARERVQREHSNLQEALEQADSREGIRWEDAQMQEAMQYQESPAETQTQGQEPKMKREQSGLQDALQQIRQSPGGMLRRLSKAGSRARSRSPFKSSRKNLTNPDAELSTYDLRSRGRKSLG
ncbi:hypothetical protein E2P81_ATG01213 [Venturia nashicola]|uniref:Uncharacterized protein n=1 Tax=Venturia nashicola TaxID=86259 RepID=A0A4Z1PBI8_9PEZI|nr:hypothetical protein E6O75_ATG01241 [Venturia nashicola]TLD38670.1 hypothetical protein E2P81_ATG01213 [Venturia nashicola]